MSLLKYLKNLYKRLEIRAYKYLKNHTDPDTNHIKHILTLASKVDYSVINFNDQTNFTQIPCCVSNIIELTALLNYIAYQIKQDDSVRNVFIESHAVFTQSVMLYDFVISDDVVISSDNINHQLKELIHRYIELSGYYYTPNTSEYWSYNKKFLKHVLEDAEGMFLTLMDLALMKKT